jgi:hypothetical protein
LTVFSYFQEKEEICSGKVIIAHWKEACLTQLLFYLLPLFSVSV